MKQTGIKIEKKNKNLKRRAEKKEEPKGPSVQDKMKEYDKNVVAEKFEDLNTGNKFDASKNHWNTTNKFQTDASGNKGITHNANIQKQLDQRDETLQKF